ncbi:MAG: sugar phosphate isomerase/epimerase [Clostridia bacterium]|nr:sugar phosphate isomerase/epimerase [Clostridia bacterium]
MYRFAAFADEASSRVKEQIVAMRRNGISLLEIRGVDGTNISKITAEKAKEVRRMLDDAGMAVWSMGSPIGKISLADDFAPHLDEYKRILEYADILGAQKIRLFSFYPIEGESEETTLARVLERLNAFCELVPDGITLCHENEKRIYGETPEKCLKLHQALPKLRAVFDPANFVQCDVDTKAAWEMLKPYVDYLHIKDARLDNHKVVPAGAGDGNLPYVIKDYLARGGEVMTLEPHLKVFSGLSELENGESLPEGVVAYRTNDEAFDAAVAALHGVLAGL